MSFKINGVEPRRIIVEENGSATDLTHLQTYKNGVLQTVWTRPPCKLSISKGSHCNVIVGYKNYQYSQVIHNVGDGDTITFGGYLDITVTGQQGYSVAWKINGVTQTSSVVTVKIEEDVNITVTETAVLLSQDKPVISGTFKFDSTGGFYYLSCEIKNTNSHNVTASVAVYYNGDNLHGTSRLNIAANTTAKYVYGEMFSDGAKVQVTFSCEGYGNSFASTTFGKYTGTVDVTEETTTTS